MMYAVWIGGVARGGSRERPSPEAVWGCALVALISFNAFWTRPFHRIENILWLSLAFALANREFLREWKPVLSGVFCRAMGTFCACASLCGVAYLWSGVEGNMLLRQALNTQNAQLQIYLLEKAEKHPIVREEVQRNIGYHYLQVGDQTDDLETMGKGFGILWDHFRHEPHSEDIAKLLNWAQRFQIEEVIRELVSYLKPGTYRLVRAPRMDKSGRQINALIVAGGLKAD